MTTAASQLHPAAERAGADKAKSQVPALTITLIALGLLLAAGMLVSLGVGGHNMTIGQVVDAIALRWQTDAWAQSPDATIVWNLRMPRTLLAAMVGVNLSIAGVLLQGIMRNPLASPDIIGVTAGAALAATIMIVAVPPMMVASGLGLLTLPLAAFVGAMAVSVVVFALSWQPGVGTSAVRMILAGVAVSAMLGGFQGFLMVYFADRVQGVVLWLAGSLNTRSWHHVTLVAPCLLIGLGLAAMLIRPLNLLQLGEAVAHNLGVHVNLTRMAAIITASLLTGSAVCAVGVIGFVGLIIPHIMRLTVGHTHGRLMPAAMLAGAVMLVWADIGARVLGEMPVGVLTAMIGGPYFVALLYGRKLT
ncbi:iron ABC transporter permease [Planctomycetales bacterium ZRK34]|nr:iron ABC transporter permease [Planctomycetales bacterium ZRK34]